MNKQKRVKDWFNNNKGSMMTVWDARDVFHTNGGTFTSMISRLNRLGEGINSEWRTGDDGTRYKVYFKHKETRNETGFPNLS